MNRIRRITALAAAALLLLVSGSGSRAEVTMEKQENRGRVTEITWKDESGSLAAGPEGYASVRYDYDGQKTTEKYYDADGNPYEMPGGYYGRTVTRESASRISMIDYLGQDGKLVLTSMGYARITFRYFTFGAERLVIFHGENGKPVTVPSLGYAQVESQYSGTTLTGRIYMDEKGNRVDIPAGYAVMQKKMNKSRQIVRVWYEHANGTPATGPDGWYRCNIIRDNKGRIESIEYFDEKDQPTERGGCARETYTYGRDGTETLTRYDLQGNKIPFGGEAVSVRRTVKNERVTEETYLNEAGEPTTLPAGYAAVSYSYNAAGQLELIQYRDASGEKQACRQGYAAIREVRDVNGALLSRTYLDTAGQPVNSIGGVCEERYEYDDTGRMIRARRYDSTGALIPEN